MSEAVPMMLERWCPQTCIFGSSYRFPTGGDRFGGGIDP